MSAPCCAIAKVVPLMRGTALWKARNDSAILNRILNVREVKKGDPEGKLVIVASLVLPTNV